MLTLNRATLLGFTLAALALLAGLLAFQHLPDPMPTHFDAAGHPNGWSSRLVGVLIMPVLIAVIAGLFWVLPRISPKGWGMRGFEDTVAVLALVTECFLLLVDVAMLRSARTGAPLSPGLVVFGVGALFAVMGNRFGKVRRNFFIGIRTPWTLADEEVWLRTHRLAGRIFVVAGLGTMLAALLPGPAAFLAMIPLLVGAALVPVVYSYVIYRELHPRARA